MRRRALARHYFRNAQRLCHNRVIRLEPLEERNLLTAVWLGIGDGTSWHDPQNWSEGQLPQPNEDVIIEIAEPAVIRLDDATQPIGDLFFFGPNGSLELHNTHLEIRGTADIQAGTLRLDSSTLAAADGLHNAGHLDFVGNSGVDGNFTNQGEITSVSPGIASQLLMDGIFHQTMEGTIRLEIGGPNAADVDSLHFAQQADILGRLEIQFAPTVIAPPCTEMIVFHFASPQFSPSALPELVANPAGPLAWRPTLGATNYSLLLVDPSLAINVSASELNIRNGQRTEMLVCLGQPPNAVVNLVPIAADSIDVSTSVVQFRPTEFGIPSSQRIDVAHRSNQGGLEQFVTLHSASDDLRFSSEADPGLQPPTVSIVVAGLEQQDPDHFEPNDSRFEASELNSADQLLSSLSIDSAEDEDWFRWTAPARGTLSVDAWFHHDQGDLDLQVYDETGEDISWSATRTDNEHVHVAALPGQTFLVRAFGFGGDRVPNYDLTFKLNPDLPRIYLAAETTIDVYDLTGTLVGRFTDDILSAGKLGDVELDSGGLVYVSMETNAGREIAVFFPDGQLARTIPVPDFRPDDGLGPQGFGFDVLADDSIILADSGADATGRMAWDGSLIGIIQTGVLDAFDTTVLADGRVISTSEPDDDTRGVNPTFDAEYWVANPESHSLQRINAYSGDVLSFSVDEALRPTEVQPLRNNQLVFVADQPDGTILLQGLTQDGTVFFARNLDHTTGGLAVWDFDVTPQPPKLDSDGDGLLDDWEINGIDINGDGLVDLDLPALGADPFHKDLFVEVDAMTGMGPAAFAQTSQAVMDAGLATNTILDQVIDAFLHATVSNPDGSVGIRLHIQLDETAIPIEFFASRWTEFDRIKNGTDLLNRSGQFGLHAERDHENWPFINLAKRRVFRYGLFGHSIGDTLQSGVGELPGDDFLVTLGNWSTPGGTPEQQAGTFMHELGHTLGLRHGGDDDINFKPNYYSIMNYHWQVPNAFNSGWQIDFSKEDADSLDELQLIEDNGIGLSDSLQGIQVQVGPIPLHAVDVTGEVDWDRNGQISSQPVSADINRGLADHNRDGLVNDADLTPGEILHGHHDWLHLRYTFDDLQNFREYQDGDKDRPEDADADPTDLYDETPPDFLDIDPNHNDSQAEASVLDDLEPIFGLTIDNIADVDWFELPIDYLGESIIGIDADGIVGNILDLSVYDDAGNLLHLIDNDIDDGLENVTVTTAPGTSIFLQVGGFLSSQGVYNLYINAGDVNRDRHIDAADIDAVCSAIRSQTNNFDLTGDGQTDESDFNFLVHDLLKTSAGDANLDQVFDSRDLIAIFQAGTSEDTIPENSGWAEGDWNCDGEFDSADLVASMQSGTYSPNRAVR